MSDEKKSAGQFAKYGLVAAMSALSDWAIFTLLFRIFGLPVTAQCVARIVGGVVSFATNRNWSFRRDKKQLLVVEARRFLLLYAFSYMISISIFYTLVDAMGCDPYLGKLVADSACFVINFIVMKLYVFKERKGFTALLRKRDREAGKTT